MPKNTEFGVEGKARKSVEQHGGEGEVCVPAFTTARFIAFWSIDSAPPSLVLALLLAAEIGDWDGVGIASERLALGTPDTAATSLARSNLTATFCGLCTSPSCFYLSLAVLDARVSLSYSQFSGLS
jgi:hypothetical protein